MRAKQRFLSILLALCMLLIYAPMVAMAQDNTAAGCGLDDVVVEQTGSSDFMEYELGRSEHIFNIRGLFNGNFIKTTYSDRGYKVAVQVGDNVKTDLFALGDFAFGKVYTVDGVQVRLNTEFAENGRAVKLLYELYNPTESELEIKIGSSADTQIGANDKAEVSFDQSGIVMEDKDSTSSTYGARFRLLPDDSFTAKWLGYYNQAYSNIFNNTEEISYNGDSGIAWSWTAQLPADTGITFSCRIRVDSIFELGDVVLTADAEQSKVQATIPYEDVQGRTQNLWYSIDGGAFQPHAQTGNTSASVNSSIQADISAENWEPDSVHTLSFYLKDNANMKTRTLSYSILWPSTTAGSTNFFTLSFAESYTLFTQVKAATGSQITLPNDAQPGKLFLGWQDDNGVLHQAGEMYTINADTTLTARWHTHSWSSQWQKDDTHHWHNCQEAPCPVTEASGKRDYAEHTYNQRVTNDEYRVSSASCTEPAAYYLSCVCGKAGTETFADGEATGHSMTKTEAIAATCTQAGQEAYWTCSSCRKLFSDQNGTTEIARPVSIPATGHIWGVWTSNGNGTHTRICSASACGTSETGGCSGGTATCTSKAVCADCSHEYGDLNPSNHANLVKTKAKAAACTEAGNIEYWHCGDCGKYFSDENAQTEITAADTVVNEIGHTPGAAAACTIDQTCTVCGTVLAEKLGHDYSAAVTVPSCTKDGYTIHTCSRCDDSYTDMETTALGHEAEKNEAKKPTATKQGNIAYWYCERCGKYFKDEALTQEITKEQTILAETGEGASSAPSTPDTPEPETATTASPSTGDNSNIALWFVLLFAGFTGLGVTASYSYRRKHRQ